MIDQMTGQVVEYTAGALPWEDGDHFLPPVHVPGIETANYYGYCAALDGLPRAVPLEWRCHADIWLWGFDNGHREKLIQAELHRHD